LSQLNTHMPYIQPHHLHHVPVVGRTLVEVGVGLDSIVVDHHIALGTTAEVAEGSPSGKESKPAWHHFCDAHLGRIVTLLRSSLLLIITPLLLLRVPALLLALIIIILRTHGFVCVVRRPPRE
jgi:hypothetical protein